MPYSQRLTAMDGYRVSFPHVTAGSAPIALHRLLCANPVGHQGEGLYTRLVENPARAEACLQVVLYYRKQRFPYHLNDYAPVFIFLDATGGISRVLYDRGHHRVAETAPAARAPVPPLVVLGPWHSYTSSTLARHISRPLEGCWFPLTDDVVSKWWFIDGKPQLKLRSKLVDPWHPDLHGGSTTFMDESICPRCGARTLLDTMLIGADRRFRARVTCRRRHQYIAVYDPERKGRMIGEPTG